VTGADPALVDDQPEPPGSPGRFRPGRRPGLRQRRARRWRRADQRGAHRRAVAGRRPRSRPTDRSTWPAWLTDHRHVAANREP